MIRLFYVLLFFGCSASYGQALRDVDFSYLYNPNEAIIFRLKPIRNNAQWLIFYKLSVSDGSMLEPGGFTIKWDVRTSLSDKAGVVLNDSVGAGSPLEGQVKLPVSAVTQVLTATITHTADKKVWVFYRVLDPSYPLNNVVTRKQEIVFAPYISVDDSISFINNSLPKVVSYYQNSFPAALPAFSEKMGRVGSGFNVDSTFILPVQLTYSFAKKGLYLVQLDTTSIEGFAFRVEDDYPRFARIENLAGPLMYICTKQENERLRSANNDKKAFDKVILSITGNAERAKILMRSYFRRVESANEFFTSYKEGWKTDRGMIYIIFGPPDEVFRYQDREVWNYKNTAYKLNFTFVKSATIFDPDNYVLIREKKNQQKWYEVIDLWRNARF